MHSQEEFEDRHSSDSRLRKHCLILRASSEGKSTEINGYYLLSDSQNVKISVYQLVQLGDNKLLLVIFTLALVALFYALPTLTLTLETYCCSTPWQLEPKKRPKEMSKFYFIFPNFLAS